MELKAMKWEEWITCTMPWSSVNKCSMEAICLNQWACQNLWYLFFNVVRVICTISSCVERHLLRARSKIGEMSIEKDSKQRRNIKIAVQGSAYTGQPAILPCCGCLVWHVQKSLKLKRNCAIGHLYHRNGTLLSSTVIFCLDSAPAWKIVHTRR